MRIGIDVGGTNTDAVLLDGNHVHAWRKRPTSDDVSNGIVQVIQDLLKTTGIRIDDLDSVMIGTTQFTNAVVERRKLLKVGMVRISLPAGAGLKPFVDWPYDLKEVVLGDVQMIQGGYQFDGTVNSKFDELAVANVARRFNKLGLRAVAVSGLFSPVNADMELRAEEIIRNEYPDAHVTLSHRIGRLGILERENAAIINASLSCLAEDVVRSFQRALDQLQIRCPFFISQNDGTLMAAAMVEKFPVLTFASGPTNSMRGAAFLSSAQDGLVIDIGGTTTDIGALSNGFPRESSLNVNIGGVRTNFRMPDILALGLGGGSLVHGGSSVSVGPQSVSSRILEQALVFGGEILTATDIVVASGYADVGDKARVAHLPRPYVEQAVCRIHSMIEEGIDRMKTNPMPVPVVLVGGGSILIGRELSGASELIVPEYAAVANAIGAAIAQIGGEVDRVYCYDQVSREAALQDARQGAMDAAIAAGCRPESARILDIEEIPLAYVPGGAVRVRVKAIGELSLDARSNGAEQSSSRIAAIQEFSS